MYDTCTRCAGGVNIGLCYWSTEEDCSLLQMQCLLNSKEDDDDMMLLGGKAPFPHNSLP